MALGLIAAPLQARALGPEGRGHLAAIIVPLTFLSWLGDFGLGLYVRREVAQGHSLSRLVGTVGLTIVLVGVVLGLILAPLAGEIASDTPVVHNWLLIGLAMLPLTLFCNMLINIACGQEQWGLWNRARMYSAGGSLFGVVVLFVAGRLTPATAAAVILFVGLLSHAPLLRVLRGSRPLQFSRPLLSRAIPFGIRSWAATFANFCNQRLDQLFMVSFIESRDLGLYAVAVTFASLPTVLSGPVAVSILTRVARHDMRLVARALRLTLTMVFLMSVLLAAAGYPVVTALLGPEFRGSVSLMWILLGAGIPLAGTFVLGHALIGAGRPSYAGLAEVIALCITVAGLALALPQFGTIGAAWVSLAAYLCSFVYLLWHTRRIAGERFQLLLIPQIGDFLWARTHVVEMWRSIFIRIKRSPRRAAGRG